MVLQIQRIHLILSLYLVSDRFSEIKNGILADVAPTLLAIMGMEIPEEMTGKVLIK